MGLHVWLTAFIRRLVAGGIFLTVQRPTSQNMTCLTPSNLSAAAEKHLGSYALAAAAGIGALTSAQVAHAAIVLTLDAGQSITNNGTLSLFANGGPALTESLTASRFGFYSPNFIYAHHAGVANLNVLGAGAYANNLTLNTTVSANATTFIGAGANRIGFRSVSSGYLIANNGNFSGRTGYIGFSFTDPTTSTQTDYGWAQITESGNQATLTLVNAAYDNTGAAIKTGQTAATVPEPGSLGLLAGGAGCLAAWRLRSRKRKQAAADDVGRTLVS